MYHRTIYRLGDGIDRSMRWVMRVEIPPVRLSWLLTAIWLYLIAFSLPAAVSLIVNAMAVQKTTNEIAAKKKPVPDRRVSFISEAVARRYGPPKQYPKH